MSIVFVASVRWLNICVRDADYAVVIVMSVFIFASISWVVSAHKWFHGPIKNIDTNGTESLDSKQL